MPPVVFVHTCPVSPGFKFGSNFALKGLCEISHIEVCTWQSNASVHTCPVSPARVVVKFTSEMIADPSGGSSGLGFLVVMNNLI